MISSCKSYSSESADLSSVLIFRAGHSLSGVSIDSRAIFAPTPVHDPRVTKCLSAKRESRSVEFKEQFAPSDARQCLEVLKDIIAIANSGGGTLAVGIDNAGMPSGADVKPVLDYDHAKYCDLVRKYTQQNFCEFEIIEAEKDGRTIAIFLINAPDYPPCFRKARHLSNRKQQADDGLFSGNGLLSAWRQE